ncbi:DUF6265 family protein [Rudaea sp.]|uniref:DUF6265 family protein n=1 Tax=Rudaea sp. TaxID=2136325 RepID=UPI002ED23CE2
MKSRRTFVLSCLLSVAGFAFAADAPAPLASPAIALDQFAWLAGNWTLEEGASRTDEIWTTPSSNLMLGMSRTLKGGKTVAFEFVSLQKRDDGVYYVAQPSGRPPVDFRLASYVNGEAVFVNPGHADHLQRIVYRRNADGSLTARIEGRDGDKPFAKDYVYRRAVP